MIKINVYVCSSVERFTASKSLDATQLLSTFQKTYTIKFNLKIMIQIIKKIVVNLDNESARMFQNHQCIHSLYILMCQTGYLLAREKKD